MSQIEHADAVSMLHEIPQYLVPDLRHIVWRYLEPVYTCDNKECRRTVTWSLIRTFLRFNAKPNIRARVYLVFCFEVHDSGDHCKGRIEFDARVTHFTPTQPRHAAV